MLEDLLPGPLSPLLPPGSIHLHGAILMENRKNHGRMKGTAWMSTGELEMMTALLQPSRHTKRQPWSRNIKTPIWKIGRDSLMPYSWKNRMRAPTLSCLQSIINIIPYDKKQIRLPSDSEKKQRPRKQLSLKTSSSQKRRRS